MNAINRWTIVLGSCLGLCLGLGLRSTVFSIHAESSQPSAPSDAPSLPLTKNASTGLQLERSQTDKAMTKVLGRMKRTQRWLWFATRAEESSAHDMPRLLHLAQGDEDLVKMLGGHWAKRDPEHMLRFLMQDRQQAQSIKDNDDLRRQLIRDWVDHGIVRTLIAVLSDEDLYHNNHTDHDIAVDAIMRRDPELGFELMGRWRVRNLMPNMSRVRSWVEQDPAAAARIISKLSAIHARRKAMEIVASVWADDPQTALDFAKTSLTGKGFVELTSLITKQWTNSDLSSAIAYARSETNPAVLKALSGPLGAAWAKVDPAAALAWSHGDLPAPARVEAVSAAIGVIAKNDLEQGAQLVLDMPLGGAKNRAAESLLKAWISQAHDVDAIGTWLVKLGDEYTRDRALNGTVIPWALNHPTSARAFLESNYGHLAPNRMIREIADKEVRADPLAAMEWAQSLDGDHAATIEKVVLESWHHVQPEAAKQWVDRQSKAESK